MAQARQDWHPQSMLLHQPVHVHVLRASDPQGTDWAAISAPHWCACACHVRASAPWTCTCHSPTSPPVYSLSGRESVSRRSAVSDSSNILRWLPSSSRALCHGVHVFDFSCPRFRDSMFPGLQASVLQCSSASTFASIAFRRPSGPSSKHPRAGPEDVDLEALQRRAPDAATGHTRMPVIIILLACSSCNTAVPKAETGLRSMRSPT